jgi:acetyl esterase
MKQKIKCLLLASAVMFSNSITANSISFWEMDPHQVRDLINKNIFSIEAERPEVRNTQDITIKDGNRTTPLRIYTPLGKSKQFPVILLIHGGAWVAGNLDTHDNMARYLCKEVKALVVSVEYQNAPEGKFPGPLEQCYDALLWVSQHAQEFQGNPSLLAVVGDSAGGNMAAALCLLTRDRKGPTIDFQVLINPATDLTGNGTINRQDDALDPVRWYATQYVKNPNDANNPYVSPIMSKDLSNLPPTLIILAEKDDLRKDGQRYAERLISAGVNTNIYTQWEIGHLAGNAARAATPAKESLDVAVSAIRGEFIRIAKRSPI